MNRASLNYENLHQVSDKPLAIVFRAKLRDEFMRRYLEHVLPSEFQKIRHYGFLSQNSKVLLVLIRWLPSGLKLPDGTGFYVFEWRCFAWVLRLRL